VRFLHWRDSHAEIVSGKVSLSGVFERYRKEARRMIEEGGVLFPSEAPDPGNARMLAHPPGYSILIAGIYSITDDPVRALWYVQVVCDAAAAVLVFLLAAELLGWWAGLVSAMLAALSPHLAYYSLLLSPDSLAVPPVLLAVYLIVKTRKRPRIVSMLLAGALIGLSCWLNANVMLLAPFLSVVVFFTFERSKRLIFAAALVGSTIAVIAPITIRNAVVFHRFIPLSTQAGLSLVEGIGDYDKEGRLGMPRSDREARRKDAEWNERPDYGGSLWYPDGLDRDRVRFSRGLSVVRSNPVWFMRACLHRAGSMLSYNESRSREFPFNTAQVPQVFEEEPYGHPFEITEESPALWSSHPAVLVLNGAIIQGALAVRDGRQPLSSNPPADLYSNGIVFSRKTNVSLTNDGEALQITGDSSEYGNQFASAPIAVRKNTDYVLVVPVHLLNADMALKAISGDGRTVLAITAVADPEKEANSGLEENGVVDSSAPPPMAAIQLPFASGNSAAIRFVVSNNAASATAPAMQLGQVELFEMDATPYVWTGYARGAVARIQRNFTTGFLRVLILLGVVLLLIMRRSRSLLMLLAVPVYYVTVQAPLHTEYRYVLAIHYFLFVFAGVTIVCFGIAIGQATRWAIRRK